MGWDKPSPYRFVPALLTCVLAYTNARVNPGAGVLFYTRMIYRHIIYPRVFRHRNPGIYGSTQPRSKITRHGIYAV